MMIRPLDQRMGSGPNEKRSDDWYCYETRKIQDFGKTQGSGELSSFQDHEEIVEITNEKVKWRRPPGSASGVIKGCAIRDREILHGSGLWMAC